MVLVFFGKGQMKWENIFYYENYIESLKILDHNQLKLILVVSFWLL